MPGALSRPSSVQRIAIAYVDHAAELDPDVLDREIGAAARLAVDNERLEATIRARLRALQASRARIVATSDATRVRLERDLHDGAQQRLLAVSFELRLASVAMAKSGHRDSQSAALAEMLADALGEMDLALSELRTLAHGIHPVVLVEDGLVGALAGMADVSAIPVLVVADRVDRCAERTELAAYAAVVEALRQAEDAGAEWLDVNLTERAERLAVSMAARGLEDGPRWVKVGDRSRRGRRIAFLGRVGRPGDAIGGSSMRVIVAEDVLITREGIVHMLRSSDIEVVAEEEHAGRLLELVEELQPDAVVLDIRMPPTHIDEGLVAATTIRAACPDVGVVVLSQYLEPGYALRLLEGSETRVGYLLKERVFHPAVLADAVRRVTEGETVVDPTIVAQIMGRKRLR